MTRRLSDDGAKTHRAIAFKQTTDAVGSACILLFTAIEWAEATKDVETSDIERLRNALHEVESVQRSLETDTMLTKGKENFKSLKQEHDISQETVRIVQIDDDTEEMAQQRHIQLGGEQAGGST